jgi:GTP-binding protein
VTTQKNTRKRNMVVSLIGRPNVGKSSLFNALMGKQHKSITFDEPGVTRDRHYGITTLNAVASLEPSDLILVDTGGFYPDKIEETEENRDKFFNIMTGHAETAIGESDLVLMVVDVREGVLPFDEEIAKFIRTQNKEFWLLMNKYDSDKQAGTEAEFYAIPVDDYFLLSAAHNQGVTTLKERLHQKANDFSFKNITQSGLSQGVTPREEVVARFALIGAPNAGKSTLLNQLVGAERALVSDIPGTTVDPIEGYFDLFFGEEAHLLQEDNKTTKDDRALFRQYDEFRNNNPEVFSRIVNTFEKEEFLSDQKGQFYPDELELSQEAESDYYYEEGEAEGLIYEDGSEGEEVIEAESMEMSNPFEENEEALEDNVGTDSEADVAKEETEAEIDSNSFWRSIHLVDTAGIRKKANITNFVENQSVYRSLRCITESDIIIFMIDATKGIGHQDRRLMDIALEKGKSLIVCMNKFDLLKAKLKTDKEREDWLDNLRDKVPWLSFCDIIPISAKNKTGIKRLKRIMTKTIFIRRRMVPTGELNRTVFSLLERNPVVVQRSGGRRLKIKYASQVKSGPPTFLLFANRSKGIPEHYKRYIRNTLRKEFCLDNTPVHLVFRTGGDLEKRMKKLKLI